MAIVNLSNNCNLRWHLDFNFLRFSEPEPPTQVAPKVLIKNNCRVKITDVQSMYPLIKSMDDQTSYQSYHISQPPRKCYNSSQNSILSTEVKIILNFRLEDIPLDENTYQVPKEKLTQTQHTNTKSFRKHSFNFVSARPQTQEGLLYKMSKQLNCILTWARKRNDEK